MNIPLHALAVYLHDHFCQSNHTDACEWYYEAHETEQFRPDRSWESPAHRRWLEKAKDLLVTFGVGWNEKPPGSSWRDARRPLFKLVWGRGLDLDEHVVLAAGDMATVKAKRKMSGDIVIDADTGEVDQSDEWLFEWERKDPNCFARRAQRGEVWKR